MSPANGAGLNGLEFLNIDDFSAVEAMAAEAEANGSVTAWGVELSAAYMDEMRTSDPNAALRESALPTLLTYSGSEGILSSTTQAETIAAVQSLPDGQVVLDPFAAGNHNYLSDDPATAAALDKAPAADHRPVFNTVPRVRQRLPNCLLNRTTLALTRFYCSATIMAIPHNSKCRYGERGAAAAKPKAQIILCVLSSILATQMPCRSRRSGASSGGNCAVLPL